MVLELSEVKLILLFLPTLLLLGMHIIHIFPVCVHLFDEIGKQSHCFFLCPRRPSRILLLLVAAVIG